MKKRCILLEECRFGAVILWYEPVEPDKPEDTAYPEWVQPTGAEDAYNAGAVVTYNGKVYQSLVDGNVWSPSDYPQGWQEVEA